MTTNAAAAAFKRDNAEVVSSGRKFRCAKPNTSSRHQPKKADGGRRREGEEEERVIISEEEQSLSEKDTDSEKTRREEKYSSDAAAAAGTGAAAAADTCEMGAYTGDRVRVGDDTGRKNFERSVISLGVTTVAAEEEEEETDDYLEEEAEATEMSVGQMLGGCHGGVLRSEGEEEEGYGYDEEDY